MSIVMLTPYVAACDRCGSIPDEDGVIPKSTRSRWNPATNRVERY